MKKIFGEKGILNGKRVLTATLVIVLLSGITLYSVAAGHTWKSQGNIAAVRSDGTKTVISVSYTHLTLPTNREV